MLLPAVPPQMLCAAMISPELRITYPHFRGAVAHVVNLSLNLILEPAEMLVLRSFTYEKHTTTPLYPSLLSFFYAVLLPPPPPPPLPGQWLLPG
jgi:hypothetical protein